MADKGINDEINSNYRKVYRPALWPLPLAGPILFLGIFLVFIWTLITNNTTCNDWFQAIVFFGFYLFFVLFITLLIISEKIVVTPDWFEYYGPGYRIRAQWLDVILVKRSWWMALFTRSGDTFFLRRSIIKGPHWIRLLLKFIGLSQWIEIGRFDPDWRTSELINDIRRFAPHLDV